MQYDNFIIDTIYDHLLKRNEVDVEQMDRPNHFRIYTSRVFPFVDQKDVLNDREKMEAIEKFTGKTMLDWEKF